MRYRTAFKRLELIWRASNSWGSSSDVFTHNYPSGNYGAPMGFDFNWGSSDPPIIVSLAISPFGEGMLVVVGLFCFVFWGGRGEGGGEDDVGIALVTPVGLPIA